MFGKKGKMEAYNYTFEKQNIHDTLLFINIFDMLILSAVFLVFRGVARMLESKKQN